MTLEQRQSRPGARRPRRETLLPFALPHITQSEIDEVADTLRSGWLSTGPKTRRFEREFADSVGAPYAVALNSGTAALHLALKTFGVGEGDEVIVPVYTFTSTAAVVIHCGARPVFVDVDPVTCNVDAAHIEAALTERTRAIVVVHIAGLPAEMDEILAIARRRGIPVIEDAAHAFPARYRGRMVGDIGDATAFSFYATKPLATGEGGMLTLRDAEQALRVSSLALHGMSRGAWNRYGADGSWFYEVLEPGYKCNMSDLVASVGLHQLARRQWLHSRRREIARRYTAALSDLTGLRTPPEPVDIDHSWHLYMLRVRAEEGQPTRDDLIGALGTANIGTSVHFIPLHLHPYYRTAYNLQPEDFPSALAAYREEVSLPIYPGMTHDDVDYVIETIIEAAGGWL